MNHVLITGATGHVGRHVVERLPATGVRIRAMVRKPETAVLPPHVEVVRGDLSVPETLDASLENVDTVFLVWTLGWAAVAPAMERILSRARRIVYLTAPLRTPHPLFQQPNPLRIVAEEIERRIETSGIQWTFLRPGMFSINALGWWGPQIRSGADVVRWPYAALPTAPIHEGDIAEVAVRALCENGHAGAEYLLTGPQSLSQAEQLHTIGNVIGRSLRMEEMLPEEARTELLRIFRAPVIVNMLLDAWTAAAGHPAFMTSTFTEITGKPARTFREWATDHAADFRPST